MEIRRLEREIYAGRAFTARYRSNGYYDIGVSEDGFLIRYLPFAAPEANYALEGMCLGMCFGTAIGTALGNSTGIGISLGTLAGLVIGMCIRKDQKDPAE